MSEKDKRVELGDVGTGSEAGATSAVGTVADEHEIQKGAHMDFLTAIILGIISLATVVVSLGYWRRQNCVFYESAGFMPTVIGVSLLIMSILLLRDSLRMDTASHHIARLRAAFWRCVHSKRVHKSLIGLLFFGVYVFFLLGRMPFWLCSFLGLGAVLEYVQFDGTWKTALKMLVIAALSVAGIVALFQYAFSVPMP